MTASTDPMRQLLEQATRELRRLRAENERLAARGGPIAVVGLGCRFPGGADDPAAFWRLLAARVDAIREVPPGRWQLPPDAPRGARWAGLLDLPITDFDHDFFSISPREAESLDPQQRLLLEVAWESLEDAGLAPARLAGSSSGVFVGLANLDYRERVDAAPPDVYAATGNLHSTAAGRLSYVLDWHGPSIAVDTACSSSLVAVHLAIRSLQRGECDLALAGGVQLLLSPRTTDKVATTLGLAPDGRCRAFDARAHGFVRAEGCGVVVLRRLADALRDGDPIRAVLRGSAVNHNGHTLGLTAPSPRAQELLLRAALADAGLAPDQVTCIEAMGAGSPLGDAIEIEALQAVYGAPRPDGSTCLVGSLKTNFGHMEAASGVAGLIKLVLALGRETIPAQLHLDTPNPRLRLAGSAVRLAVTPTAWPRGHVPRYAGVSAFGIGGTNAHVLVEEPPAARSVTTPDDGRLVLLPISARSRGALAALLARHRDRLTNPARPSLPDLAHALAVARNHEPWRCALVGRTAADLLAALDRAVLPTTPARDRPRLVFLCPDLGAPTHRTDDPATRDLDRAADPTTRDLQAVARTPDPTTRDLRSLDRTDDPTTRDLPPTTSGLRDLLAQLADEPACREALRACEAALARPLATAPDVAVTWAVQLALAAVFRSWGVEPDAIVGHGTGAFAAAHLAGAHSLADSARRVLAGAPIPTPRPLERPLHLGPHDLPELRDATRTDDPLAGDDIVVLVLDPCPTAATSDSTTTSNSRTRITASSDSPTHLTPSSDSTRLTTSSDSTRLTTSSDSTRLTPSSDSAAAPLTTSSDSTAAPLTPSSDSTAAPLTTSSDSTAAHLTTSSDLAAPLTPASDSHDTTRITALADLRDPALALRRALAALYLAGHPVTWERPDPQRPRVPLPTYPWQRERAWIDPAPPSAAPLSPAERAEPRRAADSHTERDLEAHSADSHTERTAEPHFAAGHLTSHAPHPSESHPDPRLAAPARPALDHHLRDLVWRPLAPLAAPITARTIALVHDHADDAPDLARALADHGADVTLHNLDDQPMAAVDAIVVHLAGTPAQMPARAAARSCHRLWALIRAVVQRGHRDPPRLVVLTRGAVDGTDLEHAAVWGLARSLAHEHPELRPQLIDLDPTIPLDLLARELLAPDDADQLALRLAGDAVVRLGARLLPADPAPRLTPAGARAFRLEQDRPGTLAGLVLRAHPRSPPPPRGVEVAVEYAGLNFLDVLRALAALPSDDAPLGAECVGRVVALGSGVDDLELGDRVIALADGALGTHVHVDRARLVRLPPGLDPAAAATLPIASLTAWQALHHVARLRPGERVLIHAAAGGVGQAAVQLALARGAIVFATAGSDAKRAFLRQQGVHHVASSRDRSFVDLVRAATDGDGVDVVLNSLAGDLLDASLELLRPDGRFVEIGKRDYHDDRRVGLAPFLRRLTWSLVDLRGLLPDPARIAPLLAEVADLWTTGALRPLPHRIVPIRDVGHAFAVMARGEHTGKLVLDLRQADSVPIAPSRAPHLRPGLVLLTGRDPRTLRLAEQLAEHGATHFALLDDATPHDLADRPPHSSAAHEPISHASAGLASRARVDLISPSTDLAVALAGLDLPLVAVLHSLAPAVSAPLVATTPEQQADHLGAQLERAWQLHRLDPDLLVLCADVDATLGAAGHTAHAAAGTFLAALARHRDARGRRTVCIEWGTRDGAALDLDASAAVFTELLARGAAHTTAMRFHPRRYRESHLAVARAPLLADLRDHADDRRFRDRLAASSLAARTDRLQAHVREQVAAVLRRPPGRLGLDDPLQQAGLDSLMTLELRNRLEASLDLALSPTVLWRHSTIRALTRHLLTCIPEDHATESPPPDSAASPSAPAIHRPESPTPDSAAPSAPASIRAESPTPDSALASPSAPASIRPESPTPDSALASPSASASIRPESPTPDSASPSAPASIRPESPPDSALAPPSASASIRPESPTPDSALASPSASASIRAESPTPDSASAPANPSAASPLTAPASAPIAAPPADSAPASDTDEAARIARFLADLAALAAAHPDPRNDR